MCGVWCVMCDVWSVMCDVWCVMCDVWCVMCDVSVLTYIEVMVESLQNSQITAGAWHTHNEKIAEIQGENVKFAEGCVIRDV